MAIKLKNYTTEVPASRSIDAIERLLVDFGAFNIMKEYQEIQGLAGRRCTNISFIIEVEGMRLPFRLAGNPEKVAAWLGKQKPGSTGKWRAEQGERIAWKQQHEILHLQLSQVEMNQLEKLEVFLPYVYNIEKRQTFYERMKEQGLKELTNG